MKVITPKVIIVSVEVIVCLCFTIKKKELKQHVGEVEAPLMCFQSYVAT